MVKCNHDRWFESRLIISSLPRQVFFCPDFLCCLQMEVDVGCVVALVLSTFAASLFFFCACLTAFFVTVTPLSAKRKLVETNTDFVNMGGYCLK